MWQGPEGSRKLVGAERRLFVNTATVVLDRFREGEGYFLNISDDLLPQEDRFWFILRVVKSLLDDSPAPDLFAWNEGIVIEIFEAMKLGVDMEIDFVEDDGATRENLIHRRIICEALNQVIPDKDERKEFGLPGPRSMNLEKWHEAVDLIMDGVLSDIDALKYEEFADMDPARAQIVKAFAGIPENYFSEPPPPMLESEKKSLIKFCKKIYKEADITWNTFLESGKLV